MAERQAVDQLHQIDSQLQSSPPPRDDMIACVMALEAALLPCLPARELQAIDRSPHPSHQSKWTHFPHSSDSCWSFMFIEILQRIRFV